MTELDSIQWQKLARLLKIVRNQNAFYQERIPEVSSLDEYRERVPLLTKTALSVDQATYPPYGRLLSYSFDQYTRFSQTSGTQGLPLRWLDTAESWEWMVHCWREVYRAARVVGGETVLFAFSFGPFLGFWTSWDAALSMGCRCVPAGGLSSLARADLLTASEAGILCCTPTYAIRLGEQLQAIEKTTSVRKLIVAGEPGGSLPEVRSRIEALWPGARVYDHHGMTEIGPVTAPCPSGASDLRALEEDYLVEVLQPESHQPVAPGEVGELILTNLGRAAMPLLRYRTGDLVKLLPRVEGAADVRRFVGFEGGILARQDDMTVVRGVNLYPSSVDRVVRRFEAVEEYRVRLSGQRGMCEMAVEIELEPGADPSLADQLAQSLAAAFGLRIPVRTLEPNTLPRFEMKAKRWIREENA